MWFVRWNLHNNNIPGKKTQKVSNFYETCLRTFFTTFLNRTLISESPNCEARIFPNSYAAPQPGFDPGTSEGRFTDWASAPRQVFKNLFIKVYFCFSLHQYWPLVFKWNPDNNVGPLYNHLPLTSHKSIGLLGFGIWIWAKFDFQLSGFTSCGHFGKEAGWLLGFVCLWYLSLLWIFILK